MMGDWQRAGPERTIWLSELAIEPVAVVSFAHLSVSAHLAHPLSHPVQLSCACARLCTQNTQVASLLICAVGLATSW